MRILRYLAPLAILLAPAPGCAQAPSVATPPPSAVSGGPGPVATALFRFAVYGDTRDQHEIHRAIVKGVLSHQPALVLQTGDLVHHGDSEDEWKIFDQITKDMRQQNPYYPARGNHDVGGKKLGFYEQRVTQPILSGNKLYYSFEKANVHFISIDTEQDLGPNSDQHKWLVSDLEKARAKGMFIIPFFHKAIFSAGHHAYDKDVLDLKPNLLPLLQQYGVVLVFQGHDHVYYRTIRDGITYVVTGGGGAPFHHDDHPQLMIPGDIHEEVNHFCIADVYPDHVTVTAYRQNSTQLDRFKVPIAKK